MKKIKNFWYHGSDYAMKFASSNFSSEKLQCAIENIHMTFFFTQTAMTIGTNDNKNTTVILEGTNRGTHRRMYKI